eukprot:12217806-Alexandrium_andersonii.AAC.1
MRHALVSADVPGREGRERAEDQEGEGHAITIPAVPGSLCPLCVQAGALLHCRSFQDRPMPVQARGAST